MKFILGKYFDFQLLKFKKSKSELKDNRVRIWNFSK